VVVTAENRLALETKQTEGEDLGKLFDTQIETLQQRGCLEPVVDGLERQRSKVVSKMLGIWQTKYPEETLESLASEGIYLGLPVIPQIYRSIYDQMTMVRNGKKGGCTYLEPVEITDVVDTPQKPYYIFDVEDGEAMRDKVLQDAEKAIKKQGRRGLVVVEMIALGIHTNVLSRHYVDAVGSRYRSDRVLFLLLNNGRPELSYSLGLANSVWGAASCLFTNKYG